MRDAFLKFLRNDRGAVLADYVVLTAMVLMLGLMVISTTGPGVTGLAETIVPARTVN